MSKKSFCNYGAMQRDAERRVYETQHRARQLINGEIRSFSVPEEHHNRPIEIPLYRQQHYTPHHTQTDQELYDKLIKTEDGSSCCEKTIEHDIKIQPQSQMPSPCETPCREHDDNPILNLLGKLTGDPERTLLLILLVLLISDDTDITLILVLLYLLL